MAHGLVRFFRSNPHLIGTIITAFATIVIAFYALRSHHVQEQLKQLQANLIAMQTEPRLTGAIKPNVLREEPRPLFHYRLTNIGSDTAWAVFAQGRFLILCDTMIIYPQSYLFRLVSAGATRRGDFSRFNPLGPAETKKWGFDQVFDEFVRLSNLVNGIILVQVDVVYWSDSPINQYEHEEFFLYRKLQHAEKLPYTHFEKLSNPQDRLLRQFSSLRSDRRIGEVSFRRYVHGLGSCWDLFGSDCMLLLSNPVPSKDSFGDVEWKYRDTVIVLDSAVQNLWEYRDQLSRKGLRD